MQQIGERERERERDIIWAWREAAMKFNTFYILNLAP
jgi:hypothetical protein